MPTFPPTACANVHISHTVLYFFQGGIHLKKCILSPTGLDNETFTIGTQHLTREHQSGITISYLTLCNRTLSDYFRVHDTPFINFVCL
jgi:hypothetical protein